MKKHEENSSDTPMRQETDNNIDKNIENTEQQTIETDTEKLLKEKEEENQNLYNQLLRLRAEFDNYRRRTEEEKNRKFILGKETILIELIGLIDIFDKAIDSADKSSDIKKVVEGIHILHKEFVSFLKKEGVQPVETKNRKFDTNYHEIVEYEESDEIEEGSILKEVQRGYIFQNDVIRPAKVIVSKKSVKPETKT
ncbi:MAG: nucleotide exchange factor GrpE [Elusimicrobia bacterium CG02_land_8_20_14_3_00_37_13]|nr:MAG: nucleotide exchange factor GrpE [Elusimicrobia bacterium CG02_land_8_20_14_3_00_37_13]